MSTIVTVTMNPSVDISTAVETVLPTRKLRCEPAQRDPGGGGINVARVASRLGSDVAAVYPAGGSSGNLVHTLLDREGVESIPVTVTRDTRESFTVLEKSTGQQYRFVLPGPRLDPAEWQRCIECVLARAETAGYVVASGSLPPGVPEHIYADIAKACGDRGIRFAVDTSGPPLRAALDAGVYLVKPNLRELSDLTGMRLETEREWRESAERLVHEGRAEIVALSAGDRGALLATQDGTFRATALPVTIASAVGAGDSFVAAMVWALSEGRNAPDAFRYGVAAGSAALLTPGTDLCHAKDVHRLYEQVELRRL